MTLHNGPSRPVAPSAEASGRDPSMDDILASIRRIIADDDALPLSNSARAAQRAAAQPAPEASPTHEASPARESSPAAQPAPRPHVQPVAAPTPAPDGPKGPERAPNLKLRDFAPPAVGLRPSIADRDEGAKPAVAAAPPQSAPVLASKPAESGRAAAPVANLAEARQKANARAEAQDSLRATPSAAPEAPTAHSSAPRADVAPAAPCDTNLVSPQPSAKISASFSALVENLILRDPEIVERLARDLLRPMLQSWLDAHLPDLVEKLVRAEIERIARG